MKTQKFLTNFRKEQLALYQEAIRTNPQPEVEFLITRDHIISPTDYSLGCVSEGEDLDPFWKNFYTIQEKAGNP